jgi:hypothetical protein
MVNHDYCVVINNFLPTKTIRTGDKIAEQHTGSTFDELYARLLSRPFKLQ